MTQPTHLDLDALQAAAEAATPGPWHHCQPFMTTPKVRTIHGPVPAQRVDFVSTDQQPVHRKVIAAMEGRESAMRSEDMAYIAAANPAVVLALLDRLRKAESAQKVIGWADLHNGILITDEAKAKRYHESCYDLTPVAVAAPASTPTDSADSEGAKK